MDYQMPADLNRAGLEMMAMAKECSEGVLVMVCEDDEDTGTAMFYIATQNSYVVYQAQKVQGIGTLRVSPDGIHEKSALFDTSEHSESS